jgi:hypothetical protein
MRMDEFRIFDSMCFMKKKIKLKYNILRFRLINCANNIMMKHSKFWGLTEAFQGGSFDSEGNPKYLIRNI